MLDTQRELEESAPGASALIMQIHDELMWEVDERALRVVSETVRARMEAAAARWELRVPLPVKVRAGASWADMADV